MLGAAVGLITPLPRSSKKKEHFRPLPSQTLVDIEQFFGNVPRKPPKMHASAKSRQHSDKQRLDEQRIGEGQTVRHRGEDGSMWLDVEEEQEFAWLRSEVCVAMPTLPDLSRTEEVLWREMRYDEDSWGMETFSSVLTLPRLKSSSGEEGFIKLGAAPTSVPKSRNGSNDPDSAVSLSVRSKPRPPPLTLQIKKSAAKPRLPQVAMGSPDRPKRKHSKAEQPKTPFVRPRTAPPKPVAAIDLSKMQVSPMSDQEEDISFFDPVTPIDPVSRGRPGRWLRKVVEGVRL